MKISETLRLLRGERGMTQEEVAARVGLTRQAVSSYESGRTQPGVDILQKLADVYQVELTDIIYGRNQGVRLYEGTKTAAAVMAAILLAMQLIGSVCLWVANTFYPLLAGGSEQRLVIRAGWINAWTALNGAYGGAFPMCCVAVLVLTLCLRRPVAAKYKALCALCYGAASMVALLPWALSDPLYSAADYLTTPVLCLIELAGFLLLSLIIDWFRVRRGRGEAEPVRERAPLLRRWWFWAGLAVLLALGLLLALWPRGTAELPPVENPTFSLNGADYPQSPVMQDFLDRGWKKGKAVGWTGGYPQKNGVTDLVCTGYRMTFGEYHVQVGLVPEDVQSGLKPAQCRLQSLSLYGSDVLSFTLEGKELVGISGSALTEALGEADRVREWNGGYTLSYAMPEQGISGVSFSFPPGADTVGQILVAFAI